MVRVTKDGRTVECLGVWASPKGRAFRALDRPSTAWGYEDEPFVPTNRQLDKINLGRA